MLRWSQGAFAGGRESAQPPLNRDPVHTKSLGPPRIKLLNGQSDEHAKQGSDFLQLPPPLSPFVSQVHDLSWFMCKERSLCSRLMMLPILQVPNVLLLAEPHWFPGRLASLTYYDLYYLIITHTHTHCHCPKMFCDDSKPVASFSPCSPGVFRRWSSTYSQTLPAHFWDGSATPLLPSTHLLHMPSACTT